MKVMFNVCALGSLGISVAATSPGNMLQLAVKSVVLSGQGGRSCSSTDTPPRVVPW
jgi:hypothetical protein